MAKKSKGKHRLDKFYHLAKEQGYRSRAAFKLVQLNRQFNFLDRCRSVLDLCAAPGGWLQVAVRHLPMSSLVIGIDLAPIKAIRGVKTIVGDITTTQARQAIKKESGGAQMEVVLHDGAPNVGGAWAAEAYSQSALVLSALKLATDVLAPQGAFVTKIFRSQDYSALLYAFGQLFDRVEATKPSASRNASAEIFVVCLGYKAPAKIDPRLLDPKHLFQEVTEAPKPLGPDALLRQRANAQKRHREGYAEGLSSLHSTLPAAAFISSDTPVELLGQHSRLDLEGPVGSIEGVEDAAAMAQQIREHPATDAEIRLLSLDLQVLGRSDFKALLKWRQRLRKELLPQHTAAAAETAPASDGKAPEDDEQAGEEKLLQEMQDLQESLRRKGRRDKKHRQEAKHKARVRAAQLALSEGIGDADAQEGLFALASMRGPKAAHVGDAAVPDDEQIESSSESEQSGSDSDFEAEGDSDSDEERRRYDDAVEEGLEAAYKSYLDRKEAEGSGDDDEQDGQQANGAAEAPADSDEEEAGGGLLVELDPHRAGRAGNAAAVAQQWFSQPLFEGMDLDEDDKPAAPPGSSRPTSQGAALLEDGPSAASSDSGQAASEGVSDQAVIALAKPQHLGPVMPRSDDGPLASTRLDDSGASEFEEVPIQDSDSASSSDGEGLSDEELDNLDDQAKAEMRALGRKMLKGGDRRSILESAYHRYAFHDKAARPVWFAQDEDRHLRPPEMVDRDEVEREKEYMRAVDARPIKKVAEAKARKRKRLQVRLDTARSRAEGILEAQGTEAGGRSKAREINALYAKAREGKGASKSKPSRSSKMKGSSKGPRLDKRMLADKRQVNTKQKKKSSKGRKGTGGKGTPAGKGSKGRR
ncbi:hypothetical protein WJX73_008345 [Symbiochloris irregularis]|uniref:Putative rRNA methyltransferase n=1 Tax=Symbiochloris irregularis TaxID=706552 RepID=A0AAW1PH94_9CHLO